MGHRVVDSGLSLSLHVLVVLFNLRSERKEGERERGRRARGGRGGREGGMEGGMVA